MKKILIILCLFVSLFFGVLIIAARNADLITQASKPGIEKLVSTALDAEVHLGDIQTKIFPETALAVSSISIRKSQSLPAIEVNNITLKISLLSLLKGTVTICELSLNNPEIIINWTDTKKISNPESNIPSVYKNPKESTHLLPIALKLQKIVVQQGVIKILQKDKKEVKLSDINLSSSVSIEDSYANIPAFRVSAKIQDEIPINLDGADITYNLLNTTINIKKLIANINQFSLQLVSNFSLIKKSGTYQIESNNNSIADIINTLNSISQNNLPILSGNISVTSSGLIKDFLPYGGFNLKTENLNIDNNSLRVSNGNFTLDGHLKGFELSAKPSLHIKIDNASKIYTTVDSINGDLNFEAQKNILNTLKGELKFVLTDGGFKGINILGSVLNELVNLPILGNKFLNTNPAITTAASLPDSSYSVVTGNIKIFNNNAHISDTKIVTKLYNIIVNGDFNIQTHSAKLQTTLTIGKEFTTLLIQSAKDIDKIQEPDGTIIVPVLILVDENGKIQILPDMTKLAKTTAGKLIKEKAGQLIDKIISGKHKGLQKIFGL